MQTNAAAPTLLVISGTWPPMPCGVGDYTACLCEQLARQGVKVSVLTSYQPQPATPAVGIANLEILPQIKHWGGNIFAAAAATIDRVQPQLLLLQWPTAGYGRSLAINWLPFFLSRRFPGLPLMLTLHELRYFKSWTRWRIWPALRRAKKIVVVDPQDIPVIKQLHAPAHSRCRVIPIGSNIPAVEPGFNRGEHRRKLGIAEQDLTVAFFGLANQPKGLLVLVQALARLLPQLPNLKFMLLSRLTVENAYQAEVLQALERTGLAARTLRLEYAAAPEIARHLASADLAVLPFVDGVSLKRGSLLACLQQGLPVITTRPAPGQDLPFIHGKNIFTVSRPDEVELAAAIYRLGQDAGLRRRLGKEALELKSVFSWEKIAGEYRKLFNHVMEEME